MQTVNGQYWFFSWNIAIRYLCVYLFCGKDNSFPSDYQIIYYDYDCMLFVNG
jgi:hypothetical protein